MKVIGITCAISYNDNVENYSLSQEYVDAVNKANAIALMLPIEISRIDQMLDLVDGVILCGGVDVNPIMYNDTYHDDIGESNYKRDQFDYQIVKACALRKKPLLGICRGAQMINVAFNGTLYQDLKEKGDSFNHRQKELRQYPIHQISIEKDSFLYEIFKDETYVNSFHHQAIKDVGDHLKVTARSKDDVVEAIEHIDLPIYGLQFHPEMMHLYDDKMQQIFNQFIKRIGEK